MQAPAAAQGGMLAQLRRRMMAFQNPAMQNPNHVQGLNPALNARQADDRQNTRNRLFNLYGRG